MSKQYTLFDPNWGNIPLATAMAATVVTGQALVAPVITGGTADNLKIGDTTPTHAEFTTTQVTTLTATGLATLSTTQVGLLTATQLGNMTSFTAVSTSQVSSQVSTITSSSIVVITLKTVGGTVGNIPRVASITPGSPGKLTTVADNGDTSTYNLAVLG